HPGLLDACFQVAGATLNTEETPDTLLPFGLKSLKVYRVAEGDVWWCYARQVAAHVWDIQMADPNGQTVLAIDGFEMRPVSRDAFLGRQMADLFYLLEWRPQPLPVEAQLPCGPRAWLIIADGEPGETLAAELRGHGQQCVVAPGHRSPRSRDDFSQLLRTAQWHGIVYLWDADQRAEECDTPALAEQVTTRVVHLDQALTKGD